MPPRTPLVLACLLLPALAAPALAADANLSEDDVLWRQRVGYDPRVHGTQMPQDLQQLIARVPYAYYPYDNQLEVLFDFAAAAKLLPAGQKPPTDAPRQLVVRVLPLDANRVIAERTVALDEKGRGYALLNLPKLPAGEFRVQYAFGGATLQAARTFRRSYFEFEHCRYGEGHEVYPPFEPVKVDGAKVSVVQRTYTVNAQGLFDSVIADGHELLAEPIRLLAEDEAGRMVQWQAGNFRGRATHPDTAVFACTARSPIGTLESNVVVEEDGCARIRWTLTPAEKPVTVKRMWIEIALKESEAPLCHLVGMNSMRHNYAGAVPRGGEITWIEQPWRPARFEVSPFDGRPPAAYEVWNATQQMHWGSERWNFAPYVWLGAERRGLAWFGDHVRGYATDGKRGIQRLSIEPGRVVLRVELIQVPTLLDAPRHFEFGLQASPTKPMPADWRDYDVPGGGGMQVNVWGGYNCAWHYPDPKDWTLVEKMISARGARVDPNWDPKAFRAFLEAMDKKRQFPDLKVHGRATWLDDLLGWSGRVGHPNGFTIYYEEFQTSGHHPESDEYQDEWDMDDWCRYSKFNYAWNHRGRDAWGPQARTANPQSWRDFAVYHASQWMQRGVGIYYDNTMPQVERNHRQLRGLGVEWSSSTWGHRDYFRRVWKRSRELMAKGLTPLDPLYQKSDPTRRMRLHVVGHVTNCQVLPYTTWWDATLGVEAPGPWVPDDAPSAEQKQKQLDEWGFEILPTPKQGKTGTALPYPPDYLRAMEMGRMAGLIPHYRHRLRGEDAFGGLGIGYGSTGKPAEEIRLHRTLSDAGMGLVHEIRGGGRDGLAGDLRRILREYGYGEPNVTVHNYWASPPYVAVADAGVKWIAMTRGPGEPGLVLLQSYHAEPCKTTVRFPGAGAYLDLLTRQLLPADKPVELEGDYGTRLLLAGPSAEALKPLAWGPEVITAAAFELGLPAGWMDRGDHAPRIVPDPAQAGNHVLRIRPAHPSQHWVQTQADGSYELSFRYRLPAVPGKPPYRQTYGFLQLVHHLSAEWPKTSAYTLSLAVTPGADGNAVFVAGYRASRDGNEAPFANVKADRLADAGSLVPLDTAWHAVRIRVAGTRHQLWIDRQLLLDGTCDASSQGKLRIGPGWGSWDAGIPYVDVDDLRVLRIKRE